MDDLTGDWQHWIPPAGAALGVEPGLVDVAAIHALGGQVAAVVTRPLAPVSAFLIGMSVGGGVPFADAAAALLDVPVHQAIVLAGGRGSRLGGLDKAGLELGGRRLLDRVLDATQAAAATVVVGDVTVPSEVLRTLEDPPGSGPAAGLAAGLERLGTSADWTVLLACDLPAALPAVWALLWAARHADPGIDGCCLRHPDGQLDWLTGVYRTPRLAAAVAAYGDPRNRSVRGLLADLRLTGVSAPSLARKDLDTPADRLEWEAVLGAAADVDPTWQAWAEAAATALGLPERLANVPYLLRLTKRVAHATARPLAPVAAFLLGVAVGRGASLEVAAARLLAVLPAPPATGGQGAPLVE